jgi:Na+-translocating ferredoxin:NAD+ oxidoreductase RnfE subunit
MSNQEKEPWFSAKNLKLLTEPFGTNNPITVQVLGICSALAVTVKLKPASNRLSAQLSLLYQIGDGSLQAIHSRPHKDYSSLL